MRESAMSDNKSIRLDDDTKSYKDLEESLYLPKQTLIVKNSDDSSFTEEKEINLENSKSNISLKENNKKEKNDQLTKNINEKSVINEMEKKFEKSKITLGNRINSLILEKKKNIALHLKIIY